MITESFLNTCFSVVLNEKSKIKKNKTLYRDILSVLNFYKKENSDIPIDVKSKFECLIKVCEMLSVDKTVRNSLDSLMHTPKFQPLSDFLEHKRSEELKDNVSIDNVKQIRLRKKINSLFSNYKDLEVFINQIKEGTFDSLDDLLLDYEEIIKTLYSNMMTENRGVSIEASASLDLVDDEYDHVLDLILKKYERKNTISTGYPIFDNEILNGGFEPSRVYVIGGAPGSGKSTLVNNLIINSSTKDMSIIDGEQIVKGKEEGVNRVFVEITLENTIEESLMRIYQALFRKKLAEMIREIKAGVNIKEKILNELKKTGSTIIMKYFPAMSISTLDIMAVLDDAIARYGKGTIKALYVDYLDLLKTDTKYDLYRIELGHITLSLKTLAVEYEIPVIVPTQLGRAAYRVQSSNELSLDQISESVKKVEHADFVMMMSKDPVKDNLVHARIGKNRSGVVNMNIDFNVDFSHYKFLNCTKVSANQVCSVTNDQRIPFGGLGLDDGMF